MLLEAKSCVLEKPTIQCCEVTFYNSECVDNWFYILGHWLKKVIFRKVSSFSVILFSFCHRKFLALKNLKENLNGC